MSRFLIVPTVFLAATAFAQTDSGGSSLFDRFDADSDGRISQQEARANPTLLENFAMADADNDGYLSRQEFTAAFGEQ